MAKLRQVEVLGAKAKPCRWRVRKRASSITPTIGGEEIRRLHLEQAKKLKDLQKENATCGAPSPTSPSQKHTRRISRRETSKPQRRRIAVQHAREQGSSERRACRWSASRGEPSAISPPSAMTKMVFDTSDPGLGQSVWPLRGSAHYSLAGASWWMWAKIGCRRIWRREGLEGSSGQTEATHDWSMIGSRIRSAARAAPSGLELRFLVEARTHHGRSVRLLTLIDEFTRQGLAIRVACGLNSAHV